MKVHSLFLKPVQAVASALLIALVVTAGAGLYPTQSARAATPATTGSGARTSRTSITSTRNVARIGVASTTEPLTKVARVKAYKAVLAARAAAAAAAAKKAIVPLSSWSSAKVSWYGPGFYGHTMAGGGTLTPKSMVVAHRTMKFGTRVQITYKGKTTIAVVQDRGPFIAGRTFDLGPGTAQALGFGGVGTITWRVIR